MISIKRTDVPNFLNKPNDQFSENDYSHATVRAELRTMQFDKCCYCERDLRQITQTEIEGEHFAPRSSKSHQNKNAKTQWHLVNTWHNLLLSCRTCNLVKGARPPFSNNGTRLIIDPSDPASDPEDEIKFDLDDDVLSLYDLKKSTSLGLSTIKNIGLYKNTFLIGQFRKLRASIEMEFNKLLTAIENEDPISIISDICTLISDLTRANMPFAAFCRTFIRIRLEKLREKDIPKLAEHHNKDLKCPDIALFTRYEMER